MFLSGDGSRFDELGEGGLTIEGWFYFEGIPKARERWLLFHKGGSYNVEFWGRDGWYRCPFGSMVNPSFGHGHGQEEPEAGISRRAIPRDRIPLNRWVHVAIQYDYLFQGPVARPYEGGPGIGCRTRWRDMLAVDQRSGGVAVNDGWVVGRTGMEPDRVARMRANGIQLRRTRAPLTIGGAFADVGRGWRPWGRYVGTLAGRVGEVRISSTARYPFEAVGGDDANRLSVPGRFETDEHTVALWHFDEGANAVEYADASGNGHTLVVNRR
ncbi:MAG: hypothetical protein ABGY41_08305 [Candidatus Poribacteria bacterium]